MIRGYVVGAEGLKEFEVALGELTDDEREIILKEIGRASCRERV